MPSYYFHLAIELSRHSFNTPNKSSPEEPADYYIPPSNLNLFDTPLPIHRASTWASYIAPKKEQRGKRNKAGDRDQKTLTPLSRRKWRTEEQRSVHFQETPTRELELETKPFAKSEQRSSTQSIQEPEQDWRFERISVESVDMEDQAATSMINRNDQSSTISLGRGLTLTGKYLPSNPRTTEFGWGVVHLYRDSQESSELGRGSNNSSEASNGGPEDVDEDIAYVDKECTTLCILAVPSYMTPSDLLGWLGEDTREHVTHFRLIRTGRSNKYMVLMKFRDAKATKKWQGEWNGKLFNSLEPENCHVVFVKSIRFEDADAEKDPSSFPDMSNDPFTPTSIPAPSSTALGAEASPRANASITAKPVPPPTPSLVELPSCPVCLERMDDTTGLATIFCQHVFHCACLQKWRGSGCPVCRYTQSEPGHGIKKPGTEESECRACGSTSNPWICLICGYVGCGRYEGAHAFSHYEQSGHSYAMDITTQHVWDYAGDAYVHRLIQNQSDGKLVELPSAMSRTTDAANSDEKLEKMSFEYAHLLTSQLDSQRLYFEQQVDRAVDKASQASAAAEHAETVAAKATTLLQSLQAAHDALDQSTVPAIERDKERAERRAKNLEKLAKQMEKDWREEKVINESLMDRIAHLEKQVQEATVRNSDLEEQNRDLSFFISGAEKLKDAGEDVREGQLGLVENEAQTSGAKKKKRGGKKK